MAIPELKAGMIITPRVASSLSFNGTWVLRKFESANGTKKESWECECTHGDRAKDYDIGDKETWALSIKMVLRANPSFVSSTKVTQITTVPIKPVLDEAFYEELING